MWSRYSKQTLLGCFVVSRSLKFTNSESLESCVASHQQHHLLLRRIIDFLHDLSFHENDLCGAMELFENDGHLSILME